ncbi:unnamed protein product, partial [Laminaria digitata]
MAGDDVLAGLGGGDLRDGGDGNDRITYVDSSVGVTVDLDQGLGTGGDAQGDSYIDIENVTGSNQADTLIGDAGVNLLDGGASNDTLAGLGGADVLTGGAGTDTADYSASALGVTVSLTGNSGTGGDAEGDTFSSIENVTGSGQADSLTGDAGANRLEGGGNNDTLVGLAGGDELIGGTGTDTADYSASDAAVTIDLTTGDASGGHATADTLTSIENLTGSDFDDVLTGTAGANTLLGGDGADSLSGDDGVDDLQGGAGDDTLEGGAGADTLDGGTGTNTADYSGSSAGVNVTIGGVNTGGDAAGDTLTNIQNVRGSSSDDNLTGDAGANELFGLGSNDTLTGLGGADTLDGGAGIDTADYSASTAVTIDLQAGTATGGDAAGDTLVSIERIVGSAEADVLRGDSQDNQLVGGDENDTLEGRGGADVLTGGAGID